MSLPIETLRDITGKTLSVVLTVILGNEYETKNYPGCYAVRTGDEVRVFLYADHENGRIAYPRAVWNARIVQAVEHFGEHPEHAQWETSQMSPQQRQQLAKAAQRPPAGPDYPQTIVSPVVGPPLSGPVAPQYTDENGATRPMDPDFVAARKPADFPKDDGGTPPTSSSEESKATPETPRESLLPDVETSEFWTAGPEWTDEEVQEEKPENEFEEGWKPRSRPTPHRDTKDVQQRTLKGSRGTAKRAVRGVGTALLLGFALLGFTPNR